MVIKQNKKKRYQYLLFDKITNNKSQTADMFVAWFLDLAIFYFVCVSILYWNGSPDIRAIEGISPAVLVLKPHVTMYQQCSSNIITILLGLQYTLSSQNQVQLYTSTIRKQEHLTM